MSSISCRAFGAAAVLALALLPHIGAGAATGVLADRGVNVRQLVVVPNGGADDVFSVETRVHCSTDCTVLARAVPGSGAWEERSPRWQGTAVAGFIHDKLGAGLVASGPDGVRVSRDGGATFATVDSAAGTLRVARRGGATLDVIIGGRERPRRVQLPSGPAADLPATGLDQSELVFHPDYPDVPKGQPTAFAAGIEPSTGLPAVASCDARFVCGPPVVVTPRKDFPRLFVSPRFAEDSTMYAAGVQGGLYRSADGGRTFSQVIVTGGQADPKTVTAIVQDLAFSPDGTVYVGVVSVVGEVNGDGQIKGGVYRSADGASWQRMAAGPPDGGTTALAVTRSGVLYAGYLHAPAGGGVVCTEDGATWRDHCTTKVAAPDASATKGSSGLDAQRPTEDHRASSGDGSGESAAGVDSRGSTGADGARRSKGSTGGSTGAFVAAATAGAVAALAASVALVYRRRSRATRLRER